MQKKLLNLTFFFYTFHMSNQERLTNLIGKPFSYASSSSETLRHFKLRGIERITDTFAICKVDDLDNFKNGIFRTIRFENVVSGAFAGA